VPFAVAIYTSPIYALAMKKAHKPFYDAFGRARPLLQAYAGIHIAHEALTAAYCLAQPGRDRQPLTGTEQMWLDELHDLASCADDALARITETLKTIPHALDAAREHAATMEYEAVKLRLMAEATPEDFEQHCLEEDKKHERIFARELKGGRIYGLNPDGSSKEE
jgi:hypothetical protein